MSMVDSWIYDQANTTGAVTTIEMQQIGGDDKLIATVKGTLRERLAQVDAIVAQYPTFDGGWMEGEWGLTYRLWHGGEIGFTMDRVNELKWSLQFIREAREELAKGKFLYARQDARVSRNYAHTYLELVQAQ